MENVFPRDSTLILQSVSPPQLKNKNIIIGKYNNEIIVRRLYLNNNQALLIPETNDKKFAPLSINIEELSNLGKAVWHCLPDNISDTY